MEIEGQHQSEWVTDSAKVFELKTVGSEAELETAKGYPPEYTHQVAGQSETVVGYKDPKFTLYYSAGRLNTFLHINFSDICHDPAQAEPDDVHSMVLEWLPQGTARSLDEFVARLEEENNFRPSGTLVHTYAAPGCQDGSVTFEIYHGDTTDEQFVEYHKRTEMWLIWYIESASTLDLEDDRWQLLHLFEKKEIHGETRYSFAGLLTICTFFGFPYCVRPRISQLCVLPQFQRRGHGEQLLQQAYKFCMSSYKGIGTTTSGGNRTIRKWEFNDICVDVLPQGTLSDITVEDPSPAFTKLRDRVDCKNMLSAFPNVEFYQQPFEVAASSIKDKLHLYEPQAQRVFEIVQLRFLNSRNPDLLQPYRLQIKKRLYQPHMSSMNSRAFRRFADNGEDAPPQIGLSEEEKEAVLTKKDALIVSMQEQFEQLTTEYLAVIDKL